MDPEEDEIPEGFEVEGEPTSEGRPIRRRVTLPEMRISPAPEVVAKERVESDEAARRALRAETRAAEDAEDGGPDAPGFLSDLGSTLLPAIDLDPARQAGVARRMRRRLGRAAEEIHEDPIAALLGGAEGFTQHGLSELMGGMFQTPEVRAGQTGSRAGIATESRPAHPYEEVRDDVQAEADAARERSPYAFGAGEGVGGLASGLALAPLEGAQGASVGARLARGALAGEAYGAANAAGASEHTLDEDPRALLHDASAGGLEGGLLGLAFSGAGEGVRGVGQAGREIAEGADLARVASVAPGRTISRTDPTIAQFASHPGGIEGQARRLRRMRIVSPAASSRDVRDRAASEYQRIGEDVLGPIRERVAEAGPVRTQAPIGPLPTPDAVRPRGVTDSLRQYADELARSPDSTDRSFAPQVREQIEAMLDAWGPDVPYAEAEAQLRRMGERTQWVSPSTGQAVRPPTEIRQETYRRLRAALDDLAEERVGAADVDTFREGRLDAQTARSARDLAEARMGRDAQSAPIGLIDSSLATAAGAAGAGPVGTAATALASRGIRGRSGALRATGAELVQSVMGSDAARALGRYGPILQRALERGVPAFTAAHYSLSQTDPEYRAAVADLEASQGTEAEALPEGFEYEDAAPPQ